MVAVVGVVDWDRRTVFHTRAFLDITARTVAAEKAARRPVVSCEVQREAHPGQSPRDSPPGFRCHDPIASRRYRQAHGLCRGVASKS